MRLVYRAAAVLSLTLGLNGCRMGHNYLALTGPRYAGVPPVVRTVAAVHDDATHSSDTLRIVSFNIEFAKRVDSALVLLTEEPELRGANVVLLQEMDVPGTRRIAEALGMSYVYYPASQHSRTGRDFGNAVLSRWPIEEDAKIVLPHHSRHTRLRRVATAATLRVGEVSVRVYSAHLGTMLDIAPGKRREQLRTILEDAAVYPRVVIGGDLNSGTVARLAKEAGYSWPTERGPRTTLIGRWDHLLFRGIEMPAERASGTVLDVRKASDHKPVWAVGLLTRQMFARNPVADAEAGSVLTSEPPDR